MHVLTNVNHSQPHSRQWIQLSGMGLLTTPLYFVLDSLLSETRLDRTQAQMGKVRSRCVSGLSHVAARKCCDNITDSFPWTASFPIQTPELKPCGHMSLCKYNKGLHRRILPDLNFKRHP